MSHPVPPEDQKQEIFELSSSPLQARMSHPIPIEDPKQQILELLRDLSVRRVVLFGEAGVGKTWIAREVCKSAIREGLCYATVWIFPEYVHERRNLVEIISLELSTYALTSVEQEDANHNVDVVAEQKVQLEAMKKFILRKLHEMKSSKNPKMTALNEQFGRPEQEGEMKANQIEAPLKKPYLLVVLDDIPDDDEDKTHDEINTLFATEYRDNFKILFIRRGNNGDVGSDEMNKKVKTIFSDKIAFYRVEFLSMDKSLDLLKKIVEGKAYGATGFDRLSRAIVKGSLGHPGAIVMAAKALNQIGDLELETAIEEAASRIESAETTPDANLITRLMRYVYEMLPSPTISNCAWYCRYLFQHYGGIHFNELITYWLMEGYFERHDHIEEAYREAHLVLMELLDRKILRVNEDNYVSMESDAAGLADYRRHGLSGSAYLGLPNVLDDANWEGLGSITHIHGMIKGNRLRIKEISTLLIDGSCFCREVLQNFYERKKLKVLVILNPKFKELPQIFSELTELQVFVLRTSTLLEKVDEIRKLVHLEVLEISGACLLNELHDDLFKEMAKLRSVNLSKSGIQSLPSSLFDRVELRWLILRGCMNLKLKPNQKFHMKLEVIDLSGSTAIKNIERRIKDLENLQTLDISRTMIRRLPFLENVPKLSRLLLSDCQSLNRLPIYRSLSGLDILDCSNSKNLKEVQDAPLKAKFIDLTNCLVEKLPSVISNQSHILLGGCHALDELPSTKALEDLEVLDLSHASNFVKFKDDSFEHLKCLRQLNLSNTIIEKLPSLSGLTELRQLLLKDCSHLENLPCLNTLTRLEILELSGCHNLVIRENESFVIMSYLKILNLSHTKVTSLPSDCFPKSLRQLIIRGCTDLKELPSLESLCNLEVLDLWGLKSLGSKESKCIKDMTKLRRLDLSGVVADEFPSLVNLTNLIELSLRGCSCKVSDLGVFGTLETMSNLQKLSLGGFAELGDLGLKSLIQLEDLDLSEMKREDYPYEISELIGLRKLRLQVNKKIAEIDWKRIKYIPEYFDMDGCESRSTEDDSVETDCSQNSTPDNFPSLVIFGTGFFKFLEKKNNSQLWDRCFQQFHFYVWLSGKEDFKQIDERTYYVRDWALLRDIKSQSRVPHNGGYHKDLKGYIEIHGYYGLLSPHKDVLTRADHISLIDDSSVTSISMIDVDILKSKKSCWLERCDKIRCVVDEEVEPATLEQLKCLYLYNLPSLDCICSNNVQPQVFMGLKSLLIECCPKLSKVFHLSLLPENLETLEIKFCDGMDMLFHPEKAAECKLQNLHLIGLPNLKTIGATLLSLKELKVRECPQLSIPDVPHECEVVKDGRKM